MKSSKSKLTAAHTQETPAAPAVPAVLAAGESVSIVPLDIRRFHAMVLQARSMLYGAIDFGEAESEGSKIALAFDGGVVPDLKAFSTFDTEELSDWMDSLLQSAEDFASFALTSMARARLARGDQDVAAAPPATPSSVSQALTLREAHADQAATVRECEPPRATARAGLLIFDPSRGCAGVITELLEGGLCVIVDGDALAWTAPLDYLEFPIAGGAVDRAGSGSPAVASVRGVGMDVKEFLRAVMLVREMLLASVGQTVFHTNDLDEPDEKSVEPKNEKLLKISLAGQTVPKRWNRHPAQWRQSVARIEDMRRDAEDACAYAMTAMMEQSIRDASSARQNAE